MISPMGANVVLRSSSCSNPETRVLLWTTRSRLSLVRTFHTAIDILRGREHSIGVVDPEEEDTLLIGGASSSTR